MTDDTIVYFFGTLKIFFSGYRNMVGLDFESKEQQKKIIQSFF